MKKGYTHITMLLDRTGSMENVKDDTIGGFNAFLKEQQEQPGDATMTLVQFDSQDVYEVLADIAVLKEVSPLTSATYVPRASTPLLDAIGRGINDLGAKLADMPEEERPEKVIFSILTDGFENASREFTRPKILEMIKDREDNHQWEFTFLGAKQDAIAAGSGMGMKIGSTLSVGDTGAGMRCAFMSLSKGTSSYRAAPDVASAKADEFYSPEDRKEQEDQGAHKPTE